MEGAEASDSWLQRLAAGEMAAAESLWRQFFTRLQSYAAVCLRDGAARTADPDDIVLSVFRSLCRMIDRQAIPSLSDPEQLWPLLAVIAARKVKRLARKVKRLARKSRRGSPGEIILETDLRAFDVMEGEVSVLGNALGSEPSPELAAALRDELEALMSRIEPAERAIAQQWLEGRTVSDVSAAVNVPERTVARKLAKIRRLLRERGERLDDIPVE